MENNKYDIRLRSAGLVNIQDLDNSIVVDLKYATSCNFTNTILYSESFGIYAEPRLAHAVAEVSAALHKVHPEFNLVVYDAARPMSVQRRMFEMVKGTTNERYVANPYGLHPGGFHNYGMAVDLSILDDNGRPLDMATEFDSFTELAHVGNEYRLFTDGRISLQQYQNRMLLYYITSAFGLIPYPYEWWHYQIDISEASKAKFILLDF